MKTHAILSVCLGTILLANCANSSSNVQTTNTAIANNSTANKAANSAANSANQTATPVAEKTVSATSNFAGNWDSEKFNVKGDKYTQLTLTIKQTGENVSGTYSVVDYIGKNPQVEDGNQTPFAGTVKDNVVTIKFDPDATVPGYEENVKYKAPADGKAPATATLTLSGSDLQWKLASGSSPFDMPREVKLNKAK